MKVTSLRYLDAKFHHPSPKIKKNPQNTNGRLAIPALAGLLVSRGGARAEGQKYIICNRLYISVALFSKNRPIYDGRFPGCSV